MEKKKINKVIPLILIILSALLFVFVNNNYNLYKNTIIRVNKVDTVETDESTNALGFKEKYYEQTLNGIVMNGTNKGKEITIVNEITSSSVITEKYRVGDELFIKNNNIEGLKRDKYVVLILIVFVLSIYLVGRIRGLYAIISALANSLIFYFGLKLYFEGLNLLLLCLIESVFFAVFSLLMASGRNKKTLSAIISVFISTLILFIITYIVVQITDYSGVNFKSMNFLTVPFEDVFMAGLLIGGFGAIMDISITMASSVSELIIKDKNIDNKSLVKSGKEIGKDILGTMINVLFFTYLCSGLPLFVLALRNGFTLYNYITSSFSLEITRFLVGSIGIVLSIPISLFISIKVLKRGDINE